MELKRQKLNLGFIPLDGGDLIIVGPKSMSLARWMVRSGRLVAIVADTEYWRTMKKSMKRKDLVIEFFDSPPNSSKKAKRKRS